MRKVIMDSSVDTRIIEANQLLDILDRQGFVDQIFALLETLSSVNGTCTIALNGAWGAGKSFVLSMLQHQLRVWKDGEKYLVFHYNCWQYDYYEEPLIAIVAAMLDDIDQQIHIFDQSSRDKLSAGLKTVLPALREIATTLVKNKIGIDLSSFSDLCKEMEEEQEKASETFKEEHGYDNYYAFKQTLESVKKQLRTLVEDRNLIVIVDELDRCLPDYAIKILERLHHLFSDIERTVLILAIDRTQLDNTVKQIFGSAVETETYLKKFINLELKLDTGNVNANFRKKYRNYLSMFDEKLLEHHISTDDFFSTLFSEMSARTQERLMEKIETIHRLLFKEEKKDYSFLCFELMMAVWAKAPFKESAIPLQVNFQRRTERVSCSHGLPHAFEVYIREHCVCQSMSVMHDGGQIAFGTPLDILELLVFYSQKIYSEVPDKFLLSEKVPRKEELDGYINDFKKFQQMIQFIQ